MVLKFGAIEVLVEPRAYSTVGGKITHAMFYGSGLTIKVPCEVEQDAWLGKDEPVRGSFTEIKIHLPRDVMIELGED